MLDFLNGALVMGLFAGYVSLARRRGQPLGLWRWIFAALGFLYLAFVIRVVLAFIDEGTLQGAVVMGTSLGAISLVWLAVATWFLFRRSGPPAPDAACPSGR
jgi:Na+/melibiose symporter-like transporter